MELNLKRRSFLRLGNDRHRHRTGPHRRNIDGQGYARRRGDRPYAADQSGNADSGRSYGHSRHYGRRREGLPAFPQIAKSLAQFIEGCDFGGFNSNRFDLPMLVEEFMRAGVDVDFRKRKFIDVQNIFHKWSNGRWWRPISSIAARISRMPIRPKPIRWRRTKC